MIAMTTPKPTCQPDYSHAKDDDCQLGADRTCTGCGAAHGDPCLECGGRAYHRPGCSEIEG